MPFCLIVRIVNESGSACQNEIFRISCNPYVPASVNNWISDIPVTVDSTFDGTLNSILAGCPMQSKKRKNPMARGMEVTRISPKLAGNAFVEVLIPGTQQIPQIPGSVPYLVSILLGHDPKEPILWRSSKEIFKLKHYQIP